MSDLSNVTGRISCRIKSPRLVSSTSCLRSSKQDFPGGPLVKNLPANARDMGLIPGARRFHMLQGN